MSKYLFLVAGWCLLFCSPSAQAGPHPMHVTFTNRSGWNVGCLLSGGNGLETKINNNTTRSYTVYSNHGVPPTITVHQINSGNLAFTLRDGGNYLIVLNKFGKLVVTFAN